MWTEWPWTTVGRPQPADYYTGKRRFKRRTTPAMWYLLWLVLGSIVTVAWFVFLAVALL